MGWMTEQLQFNPQKWWQNILFYKIAQNRSETHLSSNSMVPVEGGSFLHGTTVMV